MEELKYFMWKPRLQTTSWVKYTWPTLTSLSVFTCRVVRYHNSSTSSISPGGAKVRSWQRSQRAWSRRALRLPKRTERPCSRHRASYWKKNGARLTLREQSNPLIFTTYTVYVDNGVEIYPMTVVVHSS